MSDFFPVKNLKNVSVTNNGVILKDGVVIEDSCVTNDCYKKYMQPKFRLKYFFPIFSSSKKNYILATDEWSKNYCHWFWEALSKLIELKNEVVEPILILPKSYLKIDFMTKSLKAFGFDDKNIKIIPKRSHIRVKNLAFIPCINISTPRYYDFLKFSEVAKKLISYYLDQFELNFGERIYISRSNPKKNTPRKVSNEKELVVMLEKYDFKTVYMENFSFLEQMSIMHNAKYIVAPHGAGITNIMFAKEDCRLFELVNKKWSKTCFAEMCGRSKIAYQRFDSEEIGDNKHMELRDILVDVGELEKNLIKSLG